MIIERKIAIFLSIHFIWLIAALVEIPNHLNAQERSDSTKMGSVARAIVKAYQSNKNLGDVQTQDFSGNLLPRSISPSYIQIDDSDIAVLDHNTWNPWDTLFSVFRCYYITPIHPDVYIIAVGKDRSIAYLYGFDENDFKRLLHFGIGPVTSAQKAEQVAKLYLTTVRWPWIEGAEIVDSTVATQYHTEFSYLSPPVIVGENNTYSVRIYTINSDLKHVMLHQITMQENGNVRQTLISYQSIVMNMGRHHSLYELFISERGIAA